MTDRAQYLAAQKIIREYCHIFIRNNPEGSAKRAAAWKALTETLLAEGYYVAGEAAGN